MTNSQQNANSSESQVAAYTRALVGLSGDRLLQQIDEIAEKHLQEYQEKGFDRVRFDDSLPWQRHIDMKGERCSWIQKNEDLDEAVFALVMGSGSDWTKGPEAARSGGSESRSEKRKRLCSDGDGGGSDENAGTGGGCTNGAAAPGCEDARKESQVRLFVEAAFFPSRKPTVLNLARIGAKRTLALLIHNGFSMEFRCNCNDKDGLDAGSSTSTTTTTPLCEAARYGQGLTVRLLAHVGRCDVNRCASDTTGQTPMIVASLGGHANVGDKLHYAGADLSKRDKSGKSAAEHARAQGHPGMARVLEIAEKHGRSDQWWEKHHRIYDEWTQQYKQGFPRHRPSESGRRGPSCSGKGVFSAWAARGRTSSSANAEDTAKRDKQMKQRIEHGADWHFFVVKYSIDKFRDDPDKQPEVQYEEVPWPPDGFGLNEDDDVKSEEKLLLLRWHPDKFFSKFRVAGAPRAAGAGVGAEPQDHGSRKDWKNGVENTADDREVVEGVRESTIAGSANYEKIRANLTKIVTAATRLDAVNLWQLPDLEAFKFDFEGGASGRQQSLQRLFKSNSPPEPRGNSENGNVEKKQRPAASSTPQAAPKTAPKHKRPFQGQSPDDCKRQRREYCPQQ